MSIPRALIEAFQRGRVIPFVGAGVSLSVQPDLFPNWTQLLRLLADRLDAESAKDSATIVRSFCNKGQLLKAAEEALSELGRNRFYEVMRQTFRRPCPAAADLSLPGAIWELQPSLVVTTNYDSVLQWARPKTPQVLNHQSAELADLFDFHGNREPAIWHLHGQIDQADSLILGPTQYAGLYQQQADLLPRYRAALEQLRHAAANHTFLFIGFGLRDP